MTDDQAARQLAVLREIDEILTGLRVRFWLRGGWGVDFLLGHVTRPHADLDLVLWQRHRRRVEQALVASGFAVDRELAVQTDLIKDGQDVTLVYLERAPDGTIIGCGVPEWIWQPDALPNQRHVLQGIPARVVSPTHMLADIEGYEAATGRPPRHKDAGTIETLRKIIKTGSDYE